MQYSDKVIDHFTNPRNIGKLVNANAYATEGSPACGDQVSFYLNINDETHVIEDISFLSYGCASNIATASITTEFIKGKSLEYAKEITWKQITEELDGLPPVKIHCSVLAIDALQTAIKNYEIDKGLREPEVFTIDTIIAELKKIIHPCFGNDIISANAVKDIEYNDGKVSLQLEIANCDAFKDHIEGEIKEHLGRFKEITELVIGG
jgi:NifU-like protein involved in Fe-S cluster formation/metal-sulfur cluster biosynthetic enzyme